MFLIKFCTCENILRKRAARGLQLLLRIQLHDVLLLLFRVLLLVLLVILATFRLLKRSQKQRKLCPSSSFLSFLSFLSSFLSFLSFLSSYKRSNDSLSQLGLLIFLLHSWHELSEHILDVLNAIFLHVLTAEREENTSRRLVAELRQLRLRLLQLRSHHPEPKPIREGQGGEAAPVVQLTLLKFG